METRRQEHSVPGGATISRATSEISSSAPSFHSSPSKQKILKHSPLRAHGEIWRDWCGRQHWTARAVLLCPAPGDRRAEGGEEAQWSGKGMPISWGTHGNHRGDSLEQRIFQILLSPDLVFLWCMLETWTNNNKWRQTELRNLSC